MRNTILHKTGAAAALFMAADAATTAAKPKAAPVITAVRAASEVTLPERTSKRGSVSIFPFDALTSAGMSFGVKDRTASSLSSVISNANRKALVNKTDANGATVFKTNEITNADGSKTTVPTQEAEKVAGKRFYAIDVDKKTDPDGASVRIVREL